MYHYELSPHANERLAKLARRDPRVVETIMRTIRWLAEHAEEIAHQPIEGSPFFSLHSGPFRIPYLLDKTQKRIIVDDIARHDPAYDRINKS